MQEEIGFLKLIEEEVIVLREFELRHTVVFHHLGAEHVKSGEKPAASGGFLVGDAFAFDLIGEIVVDKVFVLGGGCEHIDVSAAQGVCDSAVGGGVLECGAQSRHHLRIDSSLGIFCESRQSQHAGNDRKKDFFHDLID